MSAKYNASLILAAHGSEAAEDSNQPLFDLAERIRQTQTFVDVTPAFLLGQPQLSNVLPDVACETVVVVPLMTADGYYLNSVIPNRLAENEGALGRHWLKGAVAGMHPRIAELMINRVHNQLKQQQIQPSETTLVLVGHGTRRNRDSAKSAFELFEQLKVAFPQMRTRVAFLDQDPEAHLVAASVLEGHTLVLPFLVSRGPHTTVDVPEAFGLPSGPEVQFPILQTSQTRSGCRITVCECPLATYPEMADICIEIAEAAISNDQTWRLPELETK